MLQALLVFIVFTALLGTATFRLGQLWLAARKSLSLWEEAYGTKPPAQVNKEINSLKQRLHDLQSQVIHDETLAELQSYGLYENAFEFEDSPRYKHELSETRAKQKQMVRDKTAATCSSPWVVDGNRRKGQKMVNEQLRLMLRAFNGDCDAAIAKMTHKNANAQLDRVYKAFTAVNKLGSTKSCEIQPDYLDFKIKELRLVREYHEKKELEREEQRAIREQIREEKKAQQELDRAKKEAEQQERRFREALLIAKAEAESSSAEMTTEMRMRISQLEQQLAEAEENTIRAISRAQLTKSGHIYVISNVGSFGEGVYKIGMTRRLDPNDRIKELGDASVPFPFDVHAMISSNNAPALETELHQKFDEHRVNLVNRRKEFFKVPLSEIRDILTVHNDAEVHWTMLADAQEYNDTVQMRKGSESSIHTPGV